MTRKTYIILAAGGSFAMLLGAYGFQYLAGMAPCEMCYWQRWPHMAAAGIGVLALMIHGRALPVFGALAALTTAGIGVYHAGVEKSWWEGPTSCTTGPVDNMSAADLLDQIMAAPLVRCDEIPWEMFGISMAGWNAIISLGFAFLWLLAARSRG